MYIKKVIKKNKNPHKKYTYLHLVENIRTPNGPRQRLILNLGNLPVPPDKYKELANCIESILTGQEALFSSTTAIYNYATKAAQKIRDKNSREKEAPPNAKADTTQEKDIRAIDINSFAASEVRSIGLEYLCHTAWQSLGIGQCLLDAGVSPEALPLLEALVVGRAVSPGSERHTKFWADNQSGIYELIGSPLRDSLNSYYRGGDVLYQCKEALEKHISTQESDLFSLNNRICFFDLTNTHFEGEMKKNGKAKFGRSKQKRNDCRLLTLALIIDEAGFIKRSALYPGNQYEAHTLQAMLHDLERMNPFNLDGDKPTIVMDAGIADEENISWLQENGFHYIVVNKGKSPFRESDVDDMHPLRITKNGTIDVSVKRFDDEKEVYLLCKSTRREQKEASMFSRQEELFIEELRYTCSGLQKKGHTKKYNKVFEKIGRLREKYPKASRWYTVEVRIDDSSDTPIDQRNAVDIVWSKKLAVSNDVKNEHGCYVLRSDRLDLDDKEIWSIYTMLTSIEQAFKDMKSHLGLRPNFHQTENRADTHMFLSVLAYHLIHAIQYNLKKSGIYENWDTIRNSMSTHTRMTFECKEFVSGEDDYPRGKIFVRLCSRPEPLQIKIYEALQLSPNPMKKKYYEICSDEKK
jgi:transposase